jgi:hypothetical protein
MSNHCLLVLLYYAQIKKEEVKRDRIGACEWTIFNTQSQDVLFEIDYRSIIKILTYSDATILLPHCIKTKSEPR